MPGTNFGGWKLLAHTQRRNPEISPAILAKMEGDGISFERLVFQTGPIFFKCGAIPAPETLLKAMVGEPWGEVSRGVRMQRERARHWCCGDMALSNDGCVYICMYIYITILYTYIYK